MDKLKEQFERIDLEDTDSKGCTVVLAEYLGKNSDVIWNWIESTYRPAVLKEVEEKVNKTLEKTAGKDRYNGNGFEQCEFCRGIPDNCNCALPLGKLLSHLQDKTKEDQ